MRSLQLIYQAIRGNTQYSIIIFVNIKIVHSNAGVSRYNAVNLALSKFLRKEEEKKKQATSSYSYTINEVCLCVAVGSWLILSKVVSEFPIFIITFSSCVTNRKTMMHRVSPRNKKKN